MTVTQSFVNCFVGQTSRECFICLRIHGLLFNFIIFNLQSSYSVRTCSFVLHAFDEIIMHMRISFFQHRLQILFVLWSQTAKLCQILSKEFRFFQTACNILCPCKYARRFKAFVLALYSRCTNSIYEFYFLQYH